jgi:hypothetical protein
MKQVFGPVNITSYDFKWHGAMKWFKMIEIAF